MKISYGSGYFFFCKFPFLIAIVLTSHFLLNACQQPVHQVDYWMAKVLEAHGGVNVLKQVSTVVFRGGIITGESRGTVVLTLSRPGKLRATMKYPAQYEDRILLGKKGWRNFGDGFEEAAGSSLDAMIFQYNHLNLPMDILDSNFEIVNIEQKVSGQNFPILELTAEGEPPMAVIIDPKTGLIKQVNGSITVGKHEVIMGVAYRNYKKVGGVMLPHRIINYVNGKTVAESSYDSVLVNAELDPKSFLVGHHAISQ